MVGGPGGGGFPDRLWRSDVLRWILTDQRPGPATRRPGGHAVVVTREVFTGGLIGRLLAIARTVRHPLADGVPERLVDATRPLGITVGGDIHITRDGSLLVAGSHRTGPVMVRIVDVDSAATLTHAAAALIVLGGDPASIPRLLHQWSEDRVVLTVEQRLPGRRPTRLGAGLVGDVAGQLARAARVMTADSPPTSSAAGAIAQQAATVVDLLPSSADTTVVVDLAAHAAAILGGDQPAGLQHGDLWHHNLLVQRGTLTGIVDWDSWQSAGVPGADLVGLVTTHARLASGHAIGHALASRTWRQAAPVLRDCGLQEPVLDALGISWWLTSVAGTLRRVPDRRNDADWLAAAIGGARGATAWLP